MAFVNCHQDRAVLAAVYKRGLTIKTVMTLETPALSGLFSDTRLRISKDVLCSNQTPWPDSMDSGAVNLNHCNHLDLHLIE